ncbi:MAG: ABC transporter ATP-binding protein [Bryobacterales bacterium]|nr:ABC transporter ATP-binding protein [Bryobacterales bacterium]
MAALVEARDLAYRYPDGAEALRGINLSVAAGDTLILFGANGAGKSTFLLHLNGLLRAARGTLAVDGLAMNDANLAAIRQRVGFVFQDADDQLFMPTVMEDVAFGLLNHGRKPEEARREAEAALAQVDMLHAATRAPYHLSGGEKRRVALAGVLAMQPKLLVLDEPTTSLDPPAQHKLTGLLARLPQTKIVSTHDAAFGQATGTRAVFFERGLIAAEGTVEEIAKRYGWAASPGR